MAIDGKQSDEESLLELAMEAGGEDVKTVGDAFEIVCDPESFSAVQEALEKAGIATEASNLAYLPDDTVDLDVDNARKVLKMMDALDDHDDVQSVAANFNIPEEAMAELEAGG